MIYLPGGPSHMDMYDLKPDAPAEFRGEFKPIKTNVPGVQICEHFPLQAQMWDKLACIRSLVAAAEHSDSRNQHRLQRERRTAPPITRRSARSSRSSAAAAATTCPPFVSLRGMTGGHRARLPRRRASAVLARTAPACRTCAWPTASTPASSTDRKTLLASFDSVRRDIDATGTMKGMDQLHQPRLRHGRLRHRPQGPRPDPRRPAGRATATRASSSS